MCECNYVYIYVGVDVCGGKMNGCGKDGGRSAIEWCFGR